MKKNKPFYHNAVKYPDSISRSSVKNLPELVFAPFSRAERSFFVMKLPWKDRSGQMNISLDVERRNIGMYANNPDLDICTVDQMPHFALYIELSISSVSITFRSSYEIIFNPYDERDMQIINNLITNQYIFVLYDKNANVVGGFESDTTDTYGDYFLSPLSLYPSNLQHIDDIVAYKRIYSPDVIVYHVGAFRSVRSTYSIDSSGAFRFNIDHHDYKACCNLLYYNKTYNFIKRLREQGMFDVFQDIAGSISSCIGFPDAHAYPSITESFSEYISILDQYATDGRVALAISKITNLAHKYSAMPFLSEFIVYLHGTTMNVDKSLVDTQKQLGVFVQVLHHFWIVLYMTNCLSRQDGKYVYVTNSGTIHEYRVPALSNLSEAYHYFEILAANMDVMSVNEGFEKLLSDCEAFADSDSFRRVPTFAEGKDLPRSLIFDSIENKTYTISQPIELFVNCFGIESIALFEPNPHTCLCKVRLEDNKVSFIVIDKTLLKTIFFSGVTGDNTDLANSIACFCCAALRDLSVLESRVFVKADVAPSKKPSNGSSPDQVRVVYLPRVRTTYLETDAQNQNTQTDSIGRIPSPRALHPVVKHLRKIKHSASPRQIELARWFGIEVPEGHTFVRPHERGSIEKETIYRSRSTLTLLISAAERQARDVLQVPPDHNEN